MRSAAVLLLAAIALSPSLARAEAQPDRFSAGGYFRIMTRPDFSGGSSKLGYSTLYGRLLNEGPWGALELKLDVLQADAGTNDVWASVHTKIEGGSFANTDAGKGRLDNFAVTQLYIKAGNILFDKVTWQLGTLDYYFGDLGLYDIKLAQIFFETVGLSARYATPQFEFLFGLGDSGYFLKGDKYSTVFTVGGTALVRPDDHFQIGVGGQALYEPMTRGNRFGPYTNPQVSYEDYYRKEAVRRFVDQNPQLEPTLEGVLYRPKPTENYSWKLIGNIGFGKLGPLIWNNFYFQYLRKHPENSYVEKLGTRELTIYVSDLTDQRTELNFGNEMLLTLIPEWLDAAWAGLYGIHTNKDNTIAPGEDNRRIMSTVLRLQLYLTRTVHYLTETSLAHEVSTLGNLFREHQDSVFQNTAGVRDPRGLAFGDSNVRDTWQLKTGIVFNPTGRGIYTRPSIRLLYGLQYSSAQAAFAHGFIENLSQYNTFNAPERHWHQVVSIEAEAWF